MALYMLDTKMCIYLMKNQPASVAQRFAQCYVGDVVISAITFAELEYGVLASSDSANQRRHLNALNPINSGRRVGCHGSVGLRADTPSDQRAKKRPARQADRCPRQIAGRGTGNK